MKTRGRSLTSCAMRFFTLIHTPGYRAQTLHVTESNRDPKNYCFFCFFCLFFTGRDISHTLFTPIFSVNTKYTYL